MIYEFNIELKKLEGKLPWTVFYIPFSIKKTFGTNGRIYVKTFIDGYQFEGFLLPSRNGHYMVFNKDMQKLCEKKIGDTIKVKMEYETKQKSLIIPDFILEKININETLLKKFNELPRYIKKEEINKIVSAKKEETKQNRLNKLIQMLLN